MIQQLFDEAKDHLLAQNERSIRGLSQCSYRGKNGTKCPIGHLITDDEYKPEMEENTVRALARKGMLPVRLIPHLRFLNELQQVHDLNNPDQWEESLDRLQVKIDNGVFK